MFASIHCIEICFLLENTPTEIHVGTCKNSEAPTLWPFPRNKFTTPLLEENDSLNLLLMVQESGEKTTGWM